MSRICSTQRLRYYRFYNMFMNTCQYGTIRLYCTYTNKLLHILFMLLTWFKELLRVTRLTVLASKNKPVNIAKSIIIMSRLNIWQRKSTQSASMKLWSSVLVSSPYSMSLYCQTPFWLPVIIAATNTSLKAIHESILHTSEVHTS